MMTRRAGNHERIARQRRRKGHEGALAPKLGFEEERTRQLSELRDYQISIAPDLDRALTDLPDHTGFAAIADTDEDRHVSHTTPEPYSKGIR